MTQVGITTDGKRAYAGLAKFHFQEGLPLTIVFDELQKINGIPSWIHLYNEFKENGMSKNNIIKLLSEHVFESYGREFRNTVINKLDAICK